MTPRYNAVVVQPTATPGAINGDPVDRFTLAHAGVGFGYGLLKLPFVATVVLAIGWELLERPLKDRFPAMFPHASQDTAPNALLDSAAVLGGWALGRSLRR